MLKISVSRKTIENRPDRFGDIPQQESAILRANMRYFRKGSGTSANSKDCETAIKEALNRYFKVDIAE
ncbi:MAG: hypothetical protein NTV99_11850 [Deltaproteobacteria bacterium]|nr:hypothetical protein [Deltaproteobacteria bacterium]